ncbi:hypothetical protein FNV43_RR17014 [Rhamnella rubrinervis]|uniref:Disease resistance RPP13-like protein 1 n=1 Tax=Rhamnella rubrinervis TaxID=2594499 RepID=A0A8K0MEC2_9ROSA|nr:hypothetical protein FNV43_RR17014 [Rhamnella rubrinervis]
MHLTRSKTDSFASVEKLHNPTGDNKVLFADVHSIVDFVRQIKVDEELLRQLRNKLLLANGVLDDAERQQITKPDVREWLEQLKDAIQKAEDLVDDIKIEADHQRGSQRRIQNIIKSVNDIVEDMNRLGLREGIGKTTLAQLVYTDVIDGKVVMEKPFVIKAWITVSDESKSDVFTLTKAIYEEVTLSSTDVKETFLLQHKLKEALQGKNSYLFLTASGMWIKKSGMAYKHHLNLQQMEVKSSRRRSVSNIAKDLATVDSQVLRLKSLTEADCWLLFSKHAFNNVDPSSSLQPQNNMTLEEVGEQYFEDLTSRSFFLVYGDNEFKMHDLMNDLATFVSGESCLRLDDNCSGNLTRRTRHISWTLLLRYCSSLDKLPESIGNLKHLRYLDLSWTQIANIPGTLGNLHEMRTLDLSYTQIGKIPDTLVMDIGNWNRVSTRILEMHLTRSKTHSFASVEKLHNPTGGSDNKGLVSKITLLVIEKFVWISDESYWTILESFNEEQFLEVVWTSSRFRQPNIVSLLGSGAVHGQHLVGYYFRKLSFGDAS